MPDDWPTLANHPSVWVRIACEKCGRRGKLRLARLAERFGADTKMVEVHYQMTRDCPWANGQSLPQGCAAHFLPPHYNDRRPAPEGD